MNNSKKYLVNFCISAISIILCLLFFEIVFRFYYHVNPHWRDDPRSKYLIPNNSFSHWHPKHFTGRCASENNEFDIIFKTNSYGMVDTEKTIKNNHLIRVALIGDSFVEGLQVNMGSRFSNLIQNKAVSNGLYFEILNFGVSWFSPALEIALYNNLIKRFNPDLVIIFIHFTDVTDDQRFKKQLVIGPNGEIISARKSQFLSNVQSNSAKTIRKSALAKWLYRTLTKYRAVNTRGQSLKENYAAWFKPVLNKDDKEAITFTENNIVMLINDIQKAGSKVWITALPISQTVFNNGNMKNRFIRTRLKKIDINNAYNFDFWIKNLAKKSGVDYIELLLPFKEAAKSEKDVPLFFTFDGHLTEHGHKLVAFILYKKLSQFRLN